MSPTGEGATSKTIHSLAKWGRDPLSPLGRSQVRAWHGHRHPLADHSPILHPRAVPFTHHSLFALFDSYSVGRIVSQAKAPSRREYRYGTHLRPVALVLREVFLERLGDLSSPISPAHRLALTISHMKMPRHGAMQTQETKAKPHLARLAPRDTCASSFCPLFSFLWFTFACRLVNPTNFWALQRIAASEMVTNSPTDLALRHATTKRPSKTRPPFTSPAAPFPESQFAKQLAKQGVLPKNPISPPGLFYLRFSRLPSHHLSS